MSITVTTVDLLAAIRDTAAFRGRDPNQPEHGLLLHTAPGWLGVTATTDQAATVCATASVPGDGDGWAAGGFVLTPDGIKHLQAFSGQAHRPDGQAEHEVQLTLDRAGALRVEEAGGLFPSTADVKIKPQVEADDWPRAAVEAAILGQLDDRQTPCAMPVPAEWLVRCGQVAHRRRDWLRQHSPGRDRCLVSVGSSWTASLPAADPIRTRLHAPQTLTTTTATEVAA